MTRAATGAEAPANAASRWRAWAGPLLAAALAAALLGLHARWLRDDRGFSLASLPGFDAYVYAAMAEQPSVFTVAPWGYRILSPTLAHLVAPGHALRGLRWVNDAALFLAALFIWGFVRRLGGRGWAALLALSVFCVSPPVADALRSPFTGDGLGVAFESAVLLSVAANASLPLVLLLLALGLMTKDVLLLLVPLTYVPMRRTLGRWRALLAAAALTLAAIGLVQALRWWWTPGLTTPHPILDRALVAAFLEDVRAAGLLPLAAVLLAGITPLAMLGGLRRPARPFLARYGYLAAATLALPFLAWMNVPATRVYGFFGDVPRLHIYALPLLIPLALWAIDRVCRAYDAPGTHAPRRAPTAWRWALTVGALLAAAYPFVAADSYRRYPLHGRREGLQVFLTCRTSLRVAQQLAAGRPAELVSRVDRDEPADSPTRRRWCLMTGWDDAAVFGNAEPTLRRATSTLLVPCLEPRPLVVSATLRSPAAARLQAVVNGEPLPSIALPAGKGTAEWRLPASALFRGDNVLALRLSDGGPVVLDSLRVSAPVSER